MEVPAGFDAGRYRLTGNVTGEPPFRGRLVHPGWEATDVRVAHLVGSDGRREDRRPGGSGVAKHKDMNMTAKYVIGIDLGTTNSVLAYAPLDAEQPQVEVLPIPQLVAAGTVESRTMLPSFLYLASAHEAAGGAFDLPWADGPRLRRRRVRPAARRPKCPTAPWARPSRGSATAASIAISRSCPGTRRPKCRRSRRSRPSQRYLEHLIAAWEAAFPDAPFAEQHVVLTVPASFDASARELTREAALAAGLPARPRAARRAAGGRLRLAGRRPASAGGGCLTVGDTLLVCDVGGGTTDLTLVGVAEEDGELMLRRIAVGNHLLVGGDNMDLALAHYVAGRFAEKGVQLDPWQSVALWHSCRTAKETLLAPDGPAETHPIAVLGRGTQADRRHGLGRSRSRRA